MPELTTISFEDAERLSLELLQANGFSADHARAIGKLVIAGQRDECHSHGLYRLLVCVGTLRTGKARGDAVPEIFDHAPGIVRVDAHRGFSPLAFEAGLPLLVEKTRSQGIAALVINRCFHFSALWPEIEAITAHRLAAIAMNPSHAWVAPANGTRPIFGTNPLAFGWPRPGRLPFVFDFATSTVARGEIELHRRVGRPIPESWAIDADGQPTTDAAAGLAGAMTVFGGHKGSALCAMIELLAGPMIGDLTSIESLGFDDGASATPYHGELLIAFDPARFSIGDAAQDAERAERLFEAISDQGARLPSQRRYAARHRSEETGRLTVSAALLKELEAELAAVRRGSNHPPAHRDTGPRHSPSSAT